MPTFEDLSGKRFGKLIVMYRAADYIQPSGQHKRMWHCVCDCGNECEVRAADLKTGNTTSCGCFQQYSRGKAQFEDLTGKKFGILTVIGRAEDHITPKGQHQRRWLCRCACGVEKIYYATQLKTGTTSCGCLLKQERQKRKELIEKEKALKKKEHILKQIDKKARNYDTDAMREAFIKAREEKLSWNNLETARPDIAKEWDFDLNRELHPKDVMVNSSLKVWWKCSNGHSYEAAIFSRTNEKGTKCPYCSNQRVLAGYNDLKTLRPGIVKEWDYELNKGLVPSECYAGSKIKVWWKCASGHSYQASISSRTGANKSGCPYCSVPAKKVLKGFNDLETTNPELAVEWDYELNEGIVPSECLAGSRLKVWWKCSNGHSYQASISSRTGATKSGCPYCSFPARKVLAGFNDLATTNPQVAAEWHPTLNGKLKPSMVLGGTNRKVWWLGKCGHSYEKAICNRTGRTNSGCPYCCSKKVLIGYNDFGTLYPEMLSEWDYEMNDVLPSEIGAGTHKKIWWKCPFGHGYKTYPSNRVGKLHTGCPICAKEGHTSFPEQALFYYVKQYCNDVVNSDYEAIGVELDLYIPSKKTAIEYDGLNWHKHSGFDEKKNKLCQDNGIVLIRIREQGLSLFDDCVCVIRDNPRLEETLNDAIGSVLNYLHVANADIDVQRDAIKIYGQYVYNRKENSIANKFPDIASEWNYSLNGDITPDIVNYGSNKVFWWNGPCGHTYKMRVSHRTHAKCGCPYCAGKRLLKGFNDLESQYPELLDEWDYQRNTDIMPDSVLSHSDKRVWWKCKECGNVWRTKIGNRTRIKSGCPACADKVIAAAKYKPVQCVETGVVYESIKQAAEMTGANVHTIGNCCRGNQKTSGKLHWRYYKDEAAD